MLIEAEASGEKTTLLNKNIVDINVANSDTKQDIISDEIDEDAMALLDDPVALIKLLRKRRGI